MLDLLGSDEFYETFDRYQPNEEDYLNLVKKLVPDDWTFPRNGTWFGCHPADTDVITLPTQGWKIHVSSNVDNAAVILNAVVPVLIDCKVSFKFALDKRILTIMNGKAYGRQASGKFITIYPTNENHFIELIDKVDQATRGIEGLYILSDKRYKDSRVVFYRYGGIMPISILDFTGRRVNKLVKPDGEQIDDVRKPYFHVPDWTRDPFGGDSDVQQDKASAIDKDDTAHDKKTQFKETETQEISLKNGRYIVTGVLGYSNSGGVYVAQDTETNSQVVIKEARPFISTTENSIELLKKEHRILKKLMHTRLFPKVIDIFNDWEHSFLVMEKIEGTSLASFSAGNNITLKTCPTKEDTQKFYDAFRKIFLQLAQILKVMHENNIVFSDFSPNNVMVDPETLKVRVLDFEAAREIGVDKPVQLFTLGFAGPDQLSGKDSSFESDFFSLGASMHAFLTPVNQIFAIYPKARYTFVESVVNDIGFPKSIARLISGLIDKSSENRPKSDKVIKILQREEEVRSPEFFVDKDKIDQYCRNIIKEVPKYILAKADYSRTDRLFPADRTVFSTNPMSLAHGASGVVYALHKMEGNVSQKVVDWILDRNLAPELYPPGLFVGLAGIGWAMLEMGLEKESRKVMESSFDHSLLYDSTDLYYGIAGWGLANLKFFTTLKDELFLQKAVEAGNFLVKNLTENEKGYFWANGDDIELGYFHGASGISVFLLYLYLASGKQRFLDVGIKALDFDSNNASTSIDGGISWKRVLDQGRIVYPYLKYGSAGVGTVAARYYRLLGDEKYKSLLEKIYDDTNRKYAVFPGLFNGLSGLGEFLLDLYDVTKEAHHLNAAYRTAAGISLFTIEKEDGIAFPGDGLSRISCDLGTGSAGIGSFLHRLVTGGRANFQLDELFPVKEPKVAATSNLR